MSRPVFEPSTFQIQSGALTLYLPIRRKNMVQLSKNSEYTYIFLNAIKSLSYRKFNWLYSK
jgi:hypothetical protein